MEILIGLAIILVVNEWRDHKFNKKTELVLAQIKRVNRQMIYISEFSKELKAIDARISSLSKDIVPLQEFITKAHTDLDTIVNEYEINGIPLGYDRGNKATFDAVEGL